MFTGLIQATGLVASVEDQPGSRRITVEAGPLAAELREGDSIAVSGVCLTALAIQEKCFQADLAEETVRRTSLTRLAPGSKVNLELPTPAGSPLGGHIVQGHVDGTGKLLSLQPAGKGEGGDWWMEIEVPYAVSRFVVEKGSIAVEGISLTVARRREDVIGIAVIPHTYKSTNLRSLRAGDLVNLESDVMLKYAAQASAKTTPELTLEFLIAHGY